MIKTRNPLNLQDLILQELLLKTSNIQSYIIVHSSCHITTGKFRSSIYDITRHKIYIIDNIYAEIIEIIDGKNILEICSIFDEVDSNEICNFLKFLIDKEIIFLTNDLVLFPKINRDNANNICLINNAIIEISLNNKIDIFIKSLKQIQECKCKEIQLRINSIHSFSQLYNTLKIACNFNFYYIEVLFDAYIDLSLDELKSILEDFPNINRIFVYDYSKRQRCCHNLLEKGYHKMPLGNINFFKKKLCDLSCGQISIKLFSTDSNYIQSESLFTNECLHKKIYISSVGDIKHCPYFKKTYGNINNTTIKHIITTQEYINISTITKDKIETCKDCEFRYFCSDCRVFTSNDNIYGKPIKCKYNIVNGTWEK